MQRRLSRMLETQRNTLRAVGHDLRTPLTSLRIRSEIIPDKLQREEIINTIDDISSMTEEILSWTKNASGLEELAAVDLYSLLSSIVDDFSEQGEDAALQCEPNITLHVRHLAMKRALNNAIKYGHRARVCVVETEQRVLVHVDDQGPGIPENFTPKGLRVTLSLPN